MAGTDTVYLILPGNWVWLSLSERTATAGIQKHRQNEAVRNEKTGRSHSCLIFRVQLPSSFLFGLTAGRAERLCEVKSRLELRDSNRHPLHNCYTHVSFQSSPRPPPWPRSAFLKHPDLPQSCPFVGSCSFPWTLLLGMKYTWTRGARVPHTRAVENLHITRLPKNRTTKSCLLPRGLTNNHPWTLISYITCILCCTLTIK